MKTNREIIAEDQVRTNQIIASRRLSGPDKDFMRQMFSKYSPTIIVCLDCTNNLRSTLPRLVSDQQRAYDAAMAFEQIEVLEAELQNKEKNMVSLAGGLEPEFDPENPCLGCLIKRKNHTQAEIDWILQKYTGQSYEDALKQLEIDFLKENNT